MKLKMTCNLFIDVRAANLRKVAPNSYKLSFFGLVGCSGKLRKGNLPIRSDRFLSISLATARQVPFLATILGFLLLPTQIVKAMDQLSQGKVVPEAGEIWVDGSRAQSLQGAFDRVRSGGLIQLGPGIFREAGVLRKSSVTVRGSEGTVLNSVAVLGKAALVIQGNNTLIEQIECSDISVRDGNGACVRMEGFGLTLRNVYFHDSEEGLLGGSKDHGTVLIEDSLFERLGNRGQSHGVYLNQSELVIRRSAFFSNRREGHEIKSGGYSTIIEGSVVASLNGVDSRLIDVTKGGRLIVRCSVLEKGPASSNSDIIGYALEGFVYTDAEITIENNIIISDLKNRHARFLHVRHFQGEPTIRNNFFVGAFSEFPRGKKEKILLFLGLKTEDPKNIVKDSRQAAGLPPFPELPKPMPCT